MTIDELGAEDAKTQKEWMEPIATSVGAQVLVTDDADALKTVADELELEHHVCKSHVKRNTEDLIDELCPKVATDADGSLSACGAIPIRRYLFNLNLRQWSLSFCSDFEELTFGGVFAIYGILLKTC